MTPRIAEQDSLELLPCPFCGSAPEFDDWNTSYRPDSKPLWGVVCKSQKCAGEIGFFNADPANAIDDWNTRPEADTLSQMRIDCEFLLSVIDSCDEAEAPSWEMELEDVANIARIRRELFPTTTKIEKDAQ